MPTIQTILVAHNRYQDAMISSFEANLRDIVAAAQTRVTAALARSLAMTAGRIDATPANYRVMRSLNDLFVAEMARAGYPQLVEAFVGEFGGTLQFLDESLRLLSAGLKTPLPLTELDRNDGVLKGFKITAADALGDAVRAVAGATMTRSMMSVGGLEFGSLVEMLGERFATTIAKASTIAETSMSIFYATASERAYQIIAQDLPPQALRFRYFGPVDKLERPFCRHLTDADKAFTDAEIAVMDNGQIPNVKLSRGGFRCRHVWLLNTQALVQDISTAAA